MQITGLEKIQANFSWVATEISCAVEVKDKIVVARLDLY